MQETKPEVTRVVSVVNNYEETTKCIQTEVCFRKAEREV